MRKMKGRMLAALALCLLCMLACAGAQAVSKSEIVALLGERQYPETVEELGLGAQNMARATSQQVQTLAQSVDVLDVFVGEFGSVLHRLENMEHEMADGDELSADARAHHEAIKELCLEASDAYAQMLYVLDEADYLFSRMYFLLDQLEFGSHPTWYMDEMKAELDELYQEGKAAVEACEEIILEWKGSNSPTVFDAFTELEEKHDDHSPEPDYRVSAPNPLLRSAHTAMTVVSHTQYCVSVIDENKKPVQNVSVTVRNSQGNILTSAKSDGSGAVVFPMSKLGANEGGAAEVTILLECEGYRSILVENNICKGGKTLPLQMVKDNGEPYIIGCSFNGRDMMYLQNGIYLSRKNDYNHTVTFTVDTKGKNGRVALARGNWNSPYATVLEGTFTASSTPQTVSVQKPLSQSGFEDAVPVSVGCGADGKSMEYTLTPFRTLQALVEKPYSLSGVSGVLGNFGITLPADIPVVGGGQLSIDLPDAVRFIPTLHVDLNGTAYLSVGGKAYPPAGKENDWKSDDLKTLEARESTAHSEAAAMLTKYVNGVIGDNHNEQKTPFLGSTSATISPYLMAIGRYNSPIGLEDATIYADDSAIYAFEINAGAIFSFNVEMTQQFFVMGAPVFVGFQFDAGLSFGFGIAGTLNMVVDESGEWDGSSPSNLLSNWKADIGPKIDIGVHVGASVFAGVGFPRALYLRVRGGVSMDAVMSILPDLGIELTVGASAGADVKVLFVNFSVNFFEVHTKLLNMHSRMVATGYESRQNVPVPSLEEVGETVLSARNATLQEAAEEPPVEQVQTLLSPESVWIERDTMPIADANIRFVPVYRTDLQGNEIESDTMAIWIGKSEKDSNRMRLMYMFMNDPNHTIQEITDMHRTAPGKTDDWSDVAFDVDYCYKPDVDRAYIYLAVTMDTDVGAENGDTYEKVAHGRKLYAGRFEIINNMLFASNTPFEAEASEDEYFTLPSVKAMRNAPLLQAGDNALEYAAAAIRTTGGNARVVTVIPMQEDAELAEGLEIDADMDSLELYLMDQLTQGVPFYLYMGQETAQDGKTSSMLAFGQGDSPDTPACYRDIQFSNIQPVRQYDEYLNYKVDYLVAVRRSVDQINQLPQNGLFLFDPGKYYRNEKGSMHFWTDLQGWDLGIPVEAGGFGTMEVNGEIYAWWMQSLLDENENELYNLCACVLDLDMTNENTVPLSTQPMTLLELKALNGKTAALNIMPVQKGESLFKAYYLGEKPDGTHLLGGFRFGMQTSLAVTAFVADTPVVEAGRSFTAFFNVVNNGMVPIHEFTVDFTLENEQGKKEKFKQLHVYVENPQYNTVSRFDGEGKEVLESQGAHAVYRTRDGNEEANGEEVEIVSYVIRYGNLFSAPDQRVVEVNNGLLPGAQHTYKAVITAPSEEWSGSVTLGANVSSIVFDGYALKIDDDSNQVSLLPSARNAPNPLVLPTVYYAAPEGDHEKNGIQADVHNNDLMLHTEVLLHNGEAVAAINIENVTSEASKDVNPHLIAMVDGTVTYEHEWQWHGDTLDSESGWSITVPLAQLAGGRPYEKIDLYISHYGSASADEYDDKNDHNNHRVLWPVVNFHIDPDPEDVTVYEGENATFSVGVVGDGGQYTYQWWSYHPDRGYQKLDGMTDHMLILTDVPLSDHKTAYACAVTDRNGVRVMSKYAVLTVLQLPANVPLTGDETPVGLWLGLLAISGGILLLALRRRIAR